MSRVVRVLTPWALMWVLMVGTAACKAGSEDDGIDGIKGEAGSGSTGDGDGDGTGGGSGDTAGGGGGDTASAGGPAVPGQLCRRLAEIQCAGEAGCCDNPGRTEAQCTEAMTGGCRQELGLDELAMSPAAGWDQNSATAAFQMFEDLAGACDPSIALWASRDNGLRGILRGTVEGGCPFLPIGDPSSDESVAAARVALASCSLDKNLACLPSLIGTWNCEPRGGAGTACFSDFNCTDGFFCDNPDARFSGVTCKSRLPPGSSCEYFRECDSMICSGGTCAADDDVQGAYCLQ